MLRINFNSTAIFYTSFPIPVTSKVVWIGCLPHFKYKLFIMNQFLVRLIFKGFKSVVFFHTFSAYSPSLRDGLL